MLLSDAIPLYLAWRTSEGYKANTVQADRIALRRLLRVVGDRPVEDITPRMVDFIYDEMTERRLRAATVNLATASMRAFFKWSILYGHQPEGTSPVLGRRYRPREAKSLTRIPLAQFPAFLDASRTPRDRMLLALGLYTMARKKEITGIKMQDVDLDSGRIQLYVSKANRFDQFPIDPALRRELARWLPIYAEEVGPLEPDYYLVPAVKGGHRSRIGWPLLPRKEMQSPEDAVHYALRAIGIDDSYHAGMHCMRRSSARAVFDELRKEGYDGALRIVQAALHHRSSRQTEEYLGLELDVVTRDELFVERGMFPSLEDDNVVSLRGSHGEDRAVGM